MIILKTIFVKILPFKSIIILEIFPTQKNYRFRWKLPEVPLPKTIMIKKEPIHVKTTTNHMVKN